MSFHFYIIIQLKHNKRGTKNYSFSMSLNILKDFKV